MNKLFIAQNKPLGGGIWTPHVMRLTMNNIQILNYSSYTIYTNTSMDMEDVALTLYLKNQDEYLCETDDFSHSGLNKITYTTDGNLIDTVEYRIAGSDFDNTAINPILTGLNLTFNNIFSSRPSTNITFNGFSMYCTMYDGNENTGNKIYENVPMEGIVSRVGSYGLALTIEDSFELNLSNVKSILCDKVEIIAS